MWTPKAVSLRQAPAPRALRSTGTQQRMARRPAIRPTGGAGAPIPCGPACGSGRRGGNGSAWIEVFASQPKIRDPFEGIRRGVGGAAPAIVHAETSPWGGYGSVFSLPGGRSRVGIDPSLSRTATERTFRAEGGQRPAPRAAYAASGGRLPVWSPKNAHSERPASAIASWMSPQVRFFSWGALSRYAGW